MSAHVLLNLLNELRKSDKMRAFYRLFATRLINLLLLEYNCKILLIMTLVFFEISFGREDVRDLPYAWR